MDLAILYGIQQVIGCPFLDALMPVITACGDHGLIWIVVGIVLLIIPKTRRWGVTLLVTLGITWVICEFGVKELLARPRPFVVDPSSPRRAGTRFPRVIRSRRLSQPPCSRAPPSRAAGR